MRPRKLATPLHPRLYTGSILVLVLAALPASADFTWQEQVLQAGFAGPLGDASFDSTGVLHVAAGSGSGEALHGTWNGASFDWDTLVTGINVRTMNMQYAPNGDVGVLTSGSGVLHYSRLSGGNWSTTQIDTATYTDISMGIDSQGLGHVVYSAEQVGRQNGYYCREDSIGFWTCTQLIPTGAQIYNAKALAIDSADIVHAALYFATDYLVLARLPLPVSWDTLETGFQNLTADPRDLRITSDGGLRLFTTLGLQDGTDCSDSDAKLYAFESGAWLSESVAGSGQWPMDRYARSLDYDDAEQPHAIFENFVKSLTCDLCAMECEWGIPTGDPTCATACTTESFIRYSRFVDSVRVEEIIPNSADWKTAMLDIASDGVARIVGKRANNLVMWTRDVSTQVAPADALPASGLRVTVSPNPSTRAFSFTIAPGAGPARIDVFDIRGRRVRSIAARAGSGSAVAGESRLLTWDGTDSSGRAVAKGVYFARFDFGARTETHKLTIVR